MAETDATVLNEVKGDLFNCAPSDSLVHCVSQDLAMGKGIAVEFKKRFGGVATLKAQNKQVGEVAVLRVKQLDAAAPTTDTVEKYVYYMITKPRYFHKPTLKDFTASLNALKDLAIQNGVSSLSMPRIGCGLDKLEWDVVKKLLLDTFNGTGIVLNVYTL